MRLCVSVSLWLLTYVTYLRKLVHRRGLLHSIWLVDNDAASGTSYRKRDLDQMFESFTDRRVGSRFGEDEHETATTGSQQFCPECAGAHDGFMDFIDCGRRHAVR